MSNDDTDDKKIFIKEKIVKKISIKRKIYKIITFLFLAICFGIVSMFSAIFVEPFFRELLPKKEEPINIVIPQDKLENVEDKIDNKENKDVENIVQSAIKDYNFDVDSLNNMYNSLTGLVDDIDKAIVSIKISSSEKALLDNGIENEDEIAGVIISDVENQILIMSSSEKIPESDSIKIKFKNSREYNANIKKRDYFSGIILISLNKDDLDVETKALIKPVKLGNSYQLKKGDMLIALGAPIGVIHSSKYYNISYISKAMPLVDMNARFIYLDDNVNDILNTYLFNIRGELVSWFVSSDISNSKHQTGLGISDFKSLLEKMINGKDSPYLGIEAMDIDEKIEKCPVEKGLYISKVIADSPLYKAGVQAGDILIALDNKDIKGMSDYKNILSSLENKKKLKAIIMRYSRQEYIKLEFDVDIVYR